LTSKLNPSINSYEKLITVCFILFVLACNFSVSLTQVAGYGGIALWLIQIYHSRSWDRTTWTLGWPFIILFLAGLLSVLNSIEPLSSLPYLKKLSLCLLFFCTVNTLNQTRLIDFFLWMSDFLKPSKLKIILTNWLNSHRATPSTILLINILILAGTASACLGLFQVFSAGVGLDSRTDLRGTMSHTFTFSAILMTVVLLSFSRLILGHYRKIWLYASTFIITLCLILTLTRLIWVGLFCGLILLTFIRKRILIVIFPPLLVAGYFLSPLLIQERIQSITDLNSGSNPLRLQMWNASLDVISDYPLTGCGFNCLYKIHDQYPQHPILQEFYYNLHSNIFQITVDTGLIGLAAWLGLWVAYFTVVYRKLRNRSPQSPPQWILCGSAASVLSFLIAGLFETNFYDSEVVMVLYFIMALPFVSTKTSQGTTKDPSLSRPSR